MLFSFAAEYGKPLWLTVPGRKTKQRRIDCLECFIPDDLAHIPNLVGIPCVPTKTDERNDGLISSSVEEEIATVRVLL